ncbi:replicative DNA helicase [Kitasatospora sp. NPDC028055]|uniref:replicative DNA helicase n=1 Tax=Kitasatospora sp. NPDC028055 TaxID=3155653 RepID=UPI0033ECA6A4
MSVLPDNPALEHEDLPDDEPDDLPQDDWAPADAPGMEQLPEPRWGGRTRGRRGDDAPAGDGFERVPPQDLAAEQAVLGGMMLSKDAIGDVVEVLQPADYYRPAHETIHGAILALYAQGEPADPITVAGELTRSGDLERVGGASYLHTLVNSVPTAANAEYYAEIVHERAVLRRLVEAGTRIAAMGYAAEGELDEIAQAAQTEIYQAVSARTVSTPYAPVRDDVELFFDNLDAAKTRKKLIGLSTGFAELDQLTSGLLPRQLIVIGARPGVGKSTLALDFARACAVHQQKPTAFFSLEMGRAEIVQRLFSAEAKVALHHIKAGTVTDDDVQRMARRTQTIMDAPLVIDDSQELTLMEIRSRARRIAQQHDGLALVVVDYLQLMQSGGTKRYGNRQEEISDISRNLKMMAKELECPVVALSQLNRGPEQRQDKRPMVSDLRESGSIEQDADIVILLHREDMHEKESPRAGEVELNVAKHRGGPQAVITAAFQGHYSRIVDMSRDMETSPTDDAYADAGGWTPSSNMASDLGL